MKRKKPIARRSLCPCSCCEGAECDDARCPHCQFRRGDAASPKGNSDMSTVLHNRFHAAHAPERYTLMREVATAIAADTEGGSDDGDLEQMLAEHIAQLAPTIALELAKAFTAARGGGAGKRAATAVNVGFGRPLRIHSGVLTAKPKKTDAPIANARGRALRPRNIRPRAAA